MFVDYEMHHIAWYDEINIDTEHHSDMPPCEYFVIYDLYKEGVSYVFIIWVSFESIVY